MDREVMHLRDSPIPQYATLVYNGFWFAPEREALQALVTETQKNVNGTVRLKLYKGNVITAGRKSPLSLYNPDIATMEAAPTKAYNQNDATGFIAARVHWAQKQARERIPQMYERKRGLRGIPYSHAASFNARISPGT